VVALADRLPHRYKSPRQPTLLDATFLASADAFSSISSTDFRPRKSHAPMTATRLLLILCALASASPLFAQAQAANSQATTPPAALPAWPDESPSVYTAARAAVPQAHSVAQPRVEQPVAAQPPAPIQQTTFAAPVEPAPADAANPEPRTKSRRLAPRRNQLKHSHDHNASETSELPSFGMPVNSMYTTAAALAAVVGLFLLCAALVRRGSKKANSRLPEEVVSVLGRVPLAPRQFAELVRVGNKLVLLSITATGVKPITEITDPAEIDRLVGLCKQGKKGSSTAEFDQVFRQLAEETAPPGFLGHEATRQDRRLDTRPDPRLTPPTDVFAAYRGGAKVG
jgi:flagellar biogenesis protein FliO